ncbi:DUF1345 domain-containing protein [Phenylobacterium immobile]|uniref:DUF1345 domain-containing protein n=1 Tax=Phenylobacterium immobile TaxID=21 RepID=UPI000B05CB76|nr:DUF1345 domain-containing protein [Phenylobacterium immobile]
MPTPSAMLRGRPRLWISLGLGLFAGLGVKLAWPGLQAPAIFAIGWDVACVAFIGLLLPRLAFSQPDAIRRNAAQDDEGRGLILGLMTAAAAVSVAAVANELFFAKVDHGVLRAAHVVFAFATVVLSWTVMQLIFALHYAHEYYGAGEGGGDAGGLNFPGGEEPDYWDFVHFSVVIGVASQTADISFTGKALRRVGTMHSLVAFVFNTLIVALTINLVASLF